jgi:quercetin dioxygenase-like cupin family protein
LEEPRAPGLFPGLFRRIIGTAIAKGTAVPIIRKHESSKRALADEGAESRILVGVDQGSRALHIEEVSVAPNARIPRRINPHTEVAIIVQEGKLDAILGRERAPIGPGDTVLAPAGSAHGFLNRYEEPARLLFVFPTHQVEQVEVSIPGATSGFPSERGLSGYQSPEDRPLGEGR